jgi:hypothetical protein
MRLRYTAEAQGHIAAMYNYIWDRSPAAAGRRAYSIGR